MGMSKLIIELELPIFLKAGAIKKCANNVCPYL